MPINFGFLNKRVHYLVNKLLKNEPYAAISEIPPRTGAGNTSELNIECAESHVDRITILIDSFIIETYKNNPSLTDPWYHGE